MADETNMTGSSPIVTASLISAGSNALGNLFNVYGQHQANQANMKLAEYQYEKNLEQWYRQNEYNLPINQMARLRQAGINPVLAFSGGQVTGNVVNNSPGYQAPQMHPYQVDTSGLAQIGSSYINAKMAEKQMKLMESQSHLNDVKSATENLVAVLRELQGNHQWMENQLYQESIPYLLDIVKENLNLMKSRKENTDISTEVMQQELNLFPLKQKSFEAQIRSLDASTRYALARSVGQEIQNVMDDAMKQYAGSMAYHTHLKAINDAVGSGKLNNLRDLQKVFQAIKNEQLPLEFRLKLFQAFINGTMQVAPYLAF